MTQEEANKLILEHWSKEGLAKGWVEEHIKYNAIKEENEELQQIIAELNVKILIKEKKIRDAIKCIEEKCGEYDIPEELEKILKEDE